MRKHQHPTVNEITEGVIWKQLLLFFFPIMLGTGSIISRMAMTSIFRRLHLMALAGSIPLVLVIRLQ